jgi:hypothetical protein
MTDTEHQHQKALIQWADASAAAYPELKLLYAIPNGGHRTKRTAAKMRAEGVRRGVPDLCLPVARGGFHGLYIELKRPRAKSVSPGKLTAEQLQWHEALDRQGYLVQTCWGWEAAQSALREYIGGWHNVPSE